MDSFWEVQTNLSGTYSLLEELWELMDFRQDYFRLTSGTEEFLTFCINQTAVSNMTQTVETSITNSEINTSYSELTWLHVDNLSECAAAFTDFKNHFRYILSFPHVEFPNDLRNLHRAYGLDDNAPIGDDGCACIHDETQSFPCHFDFHYPDDVDHWTFRSDDEIWCFETVDEAWKIHKCYQSTLELSFSLLQVTSFAGAVCHSEQIKKVFQLCRNPWAKSVDVRLKQDCDWVRLTNEKATRSKDHVLKVEDSARRAEPLLIRWRDHVVDIGIYNSFPVQVFHGNFLLIYLRKSACTDDDDWNWGFTPRANIVIGNPKYPHLFGITPFLPYL